jgi:hypothetical protein
MRDWALLIIALACIGATLKAAYEAAERHSDAYAVLAACLLLFGALTTLGISR